MPFMTSPSGRLTRRACQLCLGDRQRSKDMSLCMSSWADLFAKHIYALYALSIVLYVKILSELMGA